MYAGLLKLVTVWSTMEGGDFCHNLDEAFKADLQLLVFYYSSPGDLHIGIYAQATTVQPFST
jgi:hypothetical protein